MGGRRERGGKGREGRRFWREGKLGGRKEILERREGKRGRKDEGGGEGREVGRRREEKGGKTRT